MSTLLVNDIHSRLNATRVAEIRRPASIAEVRAAIRDARARNLGISLSGGRHAMGGQQFGDGLMLLDMTAMDRLIRFDNERGLAEFESGVMWPSLIAATHRAQAGDIKVWGIRQKQTGADAMTLAGSLSANAHGRGLLMQPLAGDVENLTLLTAEGDVCVCSRSRHAELFSLALGGYGLFGVMVAATLRLGPRQKLRRMVDIIDIDDAMNAVVRRVGDGCLYGDFQYAIDPDNDSFLRRGVFACYKPAPADEEVSDDAADLSHDSWLELLRLAHTDKRKAFQIYCQHYLATHERVYWSDSMQLSTYIPTYAEFLAGGTPRDVAESLVIGEHYIPPEALVEFMGRARKVLRTAGVEDIYGTIRSIRRDETSFLPYAKNDYACVIFNLRTAHTPGGIGRTHTAFRDLTDASLDLGGSFYLTYHRAATSDQVRRGYPRFPEFLRLKQRYDPSGIFVSDWYNHYRAVDP